MDGIVDGIRVAHTAELDDVALAAVRVLLFRVFDDFTEHDWSHALGGMHALASDGGEIVGHASVVQRQLIHDGRTLRTGYVEGVAVCPGHRRRGHFGALMAAMERIVRGGYELGALSASEMAAPGYAKRGWQRWRGESYALTPDGVRRTDGEEESLYVLPVAAGIDRTGPITADWRPGELW